MSRTRRVIAGLAILIVLALLLWAVLSFGLRDFVRQGIVIPLYYAYWLLELMVESTPGYLLWGVMLVIVLALAFKSLTSLRPPSRRPRRRGSQPEGRDRVRFWASLIHSARRHPRETQFRTIFARLAGEVIAFSQGIERSQLTQDVPGLELPAALRAYLNHREVAGTRRGWLRLPGRDDAMTESQLEQELQASLDYLEDQLGIENDQDNP
jgi:hypothetical protein